MLVPARGGDFRDVDIPPGAHVLKKGSGFHRDGRDAARFFHVFTPVRDELDRRAVDRQAEREVDPPHGSENVCENSVAMRIARDIIEQHCRVSHLAHVEIDDAADLALALGAATSCTSPAARSAASQLRRSCFEASFESGLASYLVPLGASPEPLLRDFTSAMVRMPNFLAMSSPTGSRNEL